MQNAKLSTAQMEDLHQRLRALPDHRKPRGVRHRVATKLTNANAAALACLTQAARAGRSQVHLLSALLPDLGVNIAHVRDVTLDEDRSQVRTGLSAAGRQ